MGFNLDNTGDTGATGASFIDTLFEVVDVLDHSKKVKFDVTGSPSTTLFLKTQQTANRTLTFPDLTDTLVSRTSTDTLTNKTMSGASNTFSNISLTTAVTGILPIANGGTNSSAALNNNRIMTSVGGAIVENSALTASAPMRTNASGLPTTGTINLSTETSGTINLATQTSGTISLTTQVSGTLPIANGGTGQTTKTLAFDALSPMTTIGDIIYGGASGTGTRLAAGTSGQYLKANGVAAPSWQSFTAPTQQVFTSGSGTYTTPANVKYIRVRMVGGGGGGAGSGTASGGNGGAGGDTTFGSSLLTAGGGFGGVWASAGGAGGTATLNSPATGSKWAGVRGGGQGFVSITGVNMFGPTGGNSVLGGAGSGAPQNAAGIDGVTNSGSGGGGGGGNSAVSMYTGGGGGAGSFIDAIIGSPSATYSYAVGAGGSNGSAGTNGFGGGAGGSGYIEVTEYYQ